MANNTQFEHDVLIIGSGAAGLTAALALAGHGRIAVLSKGCAQTGSTAWAQGGIAAVTASTDSFESHIQDTIQAGAGLCNPEVVQAYVAAAPAAVDQLRQIGVHFDPDPDEPGQPHLTREGGHSQRRVLHVADHTGAAVADALETAVRAQAGINLLEQRMAIDVVTRRRVGFFDDSVLGAYVLNTATNVVETHSARCVILATGGASKVYLYTTNPDGSTGDGIAMGWRAGCRVSNLEFNQFHPTCLYHQRARSFLISEAVRGEGGHLLLPDGTRFMHKYDKRGELAPRDVVARAIDHEIKRLGADCVFLDISHRPAAQIQQHFPTISKRCQQLGIDITAQPVPVVPAAHYTCGGIRAGIDGRTDVPGLLAVGEVACTGFHGANRIASNSLLECLVSGQLAAGTALADLQNLPPSHPIPVWDESRVTDSDEAVVITHNWQELRRFMWDYVGIVRSTKRLQRARHRVDLLQREINEYYANFRVTADLLELRNLTQVADLMVRSAMARGESRGLHYTTDFPDTFASSRDTILWPSHRHTEDNIVPLPQVPPGDIASP